MTAYSIDRSEATVLPTVMRLASLWIFPGLVLSSVISNQVGSDLRLLGMPLNAINAAAACLIVAASAKRSLAIAYIVVAAACFTLAKVFGLRGPYETMLNVLYLYAGAFAAERYLGA